MMNWNVSSLDTRLSERKNPSGSDRVSTSDQNSTSVRRAGRPALACAAAGLVRVVVCRAPGATLVMTSRTRHAAAARRSVTELSDEGCLRLACAAARFIQHRAQAIAQATPSTATLGGPDEGALVVERHRRH